MSNYIDKLKKLRFIKVIVFFFVGLFSYPGFVIFNRLKIDGTEFLTNLPKKNVLFISNHQTYFAEVIAFLHIFCAVKWRKKNRLGVPYYLLNPFTSVFFVSAEETMKKNLITRLFELAGSITVKRIWNKDSKEVRKGLDPSDTRKIERVLRNSWVINFPQGTTTPYAPGRMGSVFLIRQCEPIVIPIVISGFNLAFNKKGLGLKKRGTNLTVSFKPPLQLDLSESNEKLLSDIMLSIEQCKS